MAQESKQQIFKVQVPVAYGDLALVYNQRRNIAYQCQVTKELAKFCGTGKKQFAYGTVVGTEVTLDLTKKAPWQNW